MKRFKILLTVAATGSLVAASATSPISSLPLPGTTYVLNAQFTNNPVLPAVVTVQNAPNVTNLLSTSGLTVTDGSGKIEGVTDISFTNLNDLAPYTMADFIANVGGSITTVKSNAAVTMTLKGGGYALDPSNSNQVPATLNLGFKTSGGVQFFTNELDNITTPIISLTTNSDGSVRSNYYAVALETNLAIYPSYQSLVFINYYSRFSTNAGNPTNVLISNAISTNVYPFGQTLSTNGFYYINPGSNTNQFTNVVIAYDVTWDSLNQAQPSSNAIYGLDISQVPVFINDYLTAGLPASQYNIYTNNFGSGQELELVPTVMTNVASGYTNISVYNQFSNRWAQMNGTLSGTLTAGKHSHKFKGAAANLAQQYHTLYSQLFVGTGGASNIETYLDIPFGSRTNDNGVQYVGVQTIGSDNLSLNTLPEFRARVKQEGKNLWMSAPYVDNVHSYGGTGTLNPQKNTFKEVLTGFGLSRGSFYDMTGDTGPLITGFSSMTNVLTVTNLAAVENLALGGFGTNLTPYSYLIQATNTTLTTNFNYNVTFYTTNVIGGITNVTTTSMSGVPVPPLLATNIITNGIKSLVLSGKVQGQTVPRTPGTNANALP